MQFDRMYLNAAARSDALTVSCHVHPSVVKMSALYLSKSLCFPVWGCTDALCVLRLWWDLEFYIMAQVPS